MENYHALSLWTSSNTRIQVFSTTQSKEREEARSYQPTTNCGNHDSLTMVSSDHDFVILSLRHGCIGLGYYCSGSKCAKKRINTWSKGPKTYKIHQRWIPEHKIENRDVNYALKHTIPSKSYQMTLKWYTFLALIILSPLFLHLLLRYNVIYYARITLFTIPRCRLSINVAIKEILQFEACYVKIISLRLICDQCFYFSYNHAQSPLLHWFGVLRIYMFNNTLNLFVREYCKIIV